MKRQLKLWEFIAGAVLAYVVLFGAGATVGLKLWQRGGDKSPQTSKSSTASTEPTDSPLGPNGYQRRAKPNGRTATVTAAGLKQEFDFDPKASWAKYKGTKLTYTGRATTKASPSLGEWMFYVDGEDGLSPPVTVTDRTNAEQVREGKLVTVEGYCDSNGHISSGKIVRIE